MSLLLQSDHLKIKMEIIKTKNIIKKLTFIYRLLNIQIGSSFLFYSSIKSLIDFYLLLFYNYFMQQFINYTSIAISYLKKYFKNNF